jgi:hypothetical protein
MQKRKRTITTIKRKRTYRSPDACKDSSLLAWGLHLMRKSTPPKREKRRP